MMIEVQSICKSYRDRSKQKVYRVFEDLSFVIPEGRNVAILGRNGAGKSTLLRLLGGIDVPDRGRILTDKRISWPLGLSGGFQGSLTGRQNVKFIARVQGIYGDQLRRVIEYVEDFADIGRYFDEPVKTYSSGMRSRVGFGLSFAFDFDYYLIDEAMSTGDAHFQKKAESVLQEKIGQANIIMASHSMTTVEELCDFAIFIEKSGIILFEDVKDGIKAYQN